LSGAFLAQIEKGVPNQNTRTVRLMYLPRGLSNRTVHYTKAATTQNSYTPTHPPPRNNAPCTKPIHPPEHLF